MTILSHEQASVVNEELRRAGIAEYMPSAVHEVEGFVSRQERRFPSEDPVLFSRGLVLTYLSAAEFALLPAFAEPTQAVIPPAAPLSVGEDHARLAILKSDCPISFPVHPKEQGALPWDVMVFGGDVSKTAILLPDWQRMTEGPAVLYDLVGRLEGMHRESESTLARDVVESGAIRVQGLLWRVKLTVAGPPSFGTGIRDALDEALDTLGLRRPSGPNPF
ncbi:MAG: hypothetical protein JOY82_04765 [Streptosporangiaceae bacterium]|nr:hypothetical protein [Streptosporangiaceae bacterium]MBV9853825.1 hypothetical protein [Streptosporangiaceae bacterium]